MKKTTKTIIAIIILIVIAILVYMIFFEKAEAPQSINTNMTIPTDWKTYTDAVSGISLQTPADFTATTTKDIFSGADNFSFIIPTTTPYVHTHLLHEVRIDVSTPTTTCLAEIQGAFASSTQVVINGVMFARVIASDVGAGNLYQGIDYTTTKGNLCYRIALFTHSTNGEGFYTNDPVQINKIDALQAMDIKDLFELFDQIATTIKFTK